MKALATIIIVAILGAAGGFLGSLWYLDQYGSSNTIADAGPAADGRPPGGGGHATPVRVATLTPRDFGTRIESLGTAQARESVTITARVTATVATIEFDDGDVVEAGNVLVRLASEEEFAERREADVALREARRELARIQGLAGDGIVPRQQIDQARSRVAESEARLAAVDARLGDRVIRAPFSGVLGIRQVSPGSLVSPGTAIVELIDLSTIYIDFSVAERFLGKILLGQTVQATSVAFPDQTFEARVTAVSPRVDIATRTVNVRARAENPERQLRPGMLLNSVLEIDNRLAAALPEAAIVPQGHQQFVFIIEDDKVRRVEVSIGQRRPGYVEIISGLDDDARVVIEGVSRVRDGARVRVIDDDEAALDRDTFSTIPASVASPATSRSIQVASIPTRNADFALSTAPSSAQWSRGVDSARRDNLPNERAAATPTTPAGLTDSPIATRPAHPL